MTNEKVISNSNHGQNVKFLREFFGIKQVTFAEMIGKPQSYVSTIESKETLEDDVLEMCAKALGVSLKVLKEFDPEKMVRTNIYNIEKIENSNGGFFSTGNDSIHGNQFYPIEKIMELNKQNAELYERLLKAEQEKVATLQKLMEKDRK